MGLISPIGPISLMDIIGPISFSQLILLFGQPLEHHPQERQKPPRAKLTIGGFVELIPATPTLALAVLPSAPKA
jgi:hypothetical protein